MRCDGAFLDRTDVRSVDECAEVRATQSRGGARPHARARSCASIRVAAAKGFRSSSTGSGACCSRGRRGVTARWRGRRGCCAGADGRCSIGFMAAEACRTAVSRPRIASGAGGETHPCLAVCAFPACGRSSWARRGGGGGGGAARLHKLCTPVRKLLRHVGVEGVVGLGGVDDAHQRREDVVHLAARLPLVRRQNRQAHLPRPELALGGAGCGRCGAHLALRVEVGVVDRVGEGEFGRPEGVVVLRPPLHRLGAILQMVGAAGGGQGAARPPCKGWGGGGGRAGGGAGGGPGARAPENRA